MIPGFKESYLVEKKKHSNRKQYGMESVGERWKKNEGNNIQVW